jgi:geranylgeranyl pyrophosphate synthase
MANGASSEILAAWEQDEPDDTAIATAVRALERCGADQATREEAQRLTARAESLLSSFELPQEALLELQAVGKYLIERDR